MGRRVGKEVGGWLPFDGLVLLDRPAFGLALLINRLRTVFRDLARVVLDLPLCHPHAKPFAEGGADPARWSSPLQGLVQDLPETGVGCRELFQLPDAPSLSHSPPPALGLIELRRCFSETQRSISYHIDLL